MNIIITVHSTKWSTTLNKYHIVAASQLKTISCVKIMYKILLSQLIMFSRGFNSDQTNGTNWISMTLKVKKDMNSLTLIR